MFSRDASNNQHVYCSQRHGQQRTSVGHDAISGCSLAGHVPVDFQTGRAGGHVSRCQISHCSNQRSCQSATLPLCYSPTCCLGVKRAAGELLACYKLFKCLDSGHKLVLVTVGSATWEVTGKMRCELAVPGELDSEPCIRSSPLLAALY